MVEVRQKIWVRSEAISPRFIGKRYTLVREATPAERKTLFEDGTGPWALAVPEGSLDTCWIGMNSGVLVSD